MNVTCVNRNLSQRGTWKITIRDIKRLNLFNATSATHNSIDPLNSKGTSKTNYCVFREKV